MCFHTSDAGQAYEVSSTGLTEHVIFSLCKAVDNTECPRQVAVVEEQKSQTFFVPTAQQIEGCQVFHFTEVINCIIHVLQMKIYKLADVFVIQKEGFPIGGPLSYQFLNLILTYLETIAFGSADASSLTLFTGAHSSQSKSSSICVETLGSLGLPFPKDKDIPKP